MEVLSVNVPRDELLFPKLLIIHIFYSHTSESGLFLMELESEFAKVWEDREHESREESLW
jgi:hypothetical protein